MSDVIVVGSSAELKRAYKDIIKKYQKQIVLSIDRASNKTPEVEKEIYHDVEPLTPYKTGTLDKSLSVTQTSPSEFSVEYSASYASYALNPYSKTGKAKNYNTSIHQLATGNPVEYATKQRGIEWAEKYWECLAKEIK